MIRPNKIPDLPLNKIDKDTKGIMFTLMYECNLNCDFCFQKRSKANPITSQVKEMVSKNIKKIEELLPTYEHPYIEYKLLGGELFLSNMNWDWLVNVLQTLIDITKKVNKIPKFILMTNLIHDNNVRNIVINKIIKPIKDQGFMVRLVPSFDINGRFKNKETINIFKENALFYKEDIAQCNMVLTAPNCRLVSGLQQPTEIEQYALDTMKYLFHDNNIRFDIDYYMARNMEDDPLMPTDDELLACWLTLWYNYPNTRLISKFKINNINEVREVNCCFELQLEGNTITECCREFYGLDDNPNLETPICDNYYNVLISKYIKKNKCLLCKWYKYCPLGCFFYFDNKMKRIKNQECVLKRFFDIIKEDNNA